MKHFLPLIFLLVFGTIGLSGQSPSTGSWLASLDREEVEPGIEVFPNPATTHFGITEVHSVKKIVVYNLVGRKLKEYSDIAKDKRYYIGDVPRGMYLIQMTDSKGKVITTRRISKR